MLAGWSGNTSRPSTSTGLTVFACGQGKTKVKLGATAGLRLLPGGKADSILAAVKKYLQASPFLMDDKSGVTVLDGEPIAAKSYSHTFAYCAPASSFL